MNDFNALFANVCKALRSEQRISYRALRRRFELSDDDLEDIADELIHAKKWAIDEDSRVLVWIGEAGDISLSASRPDRSGPQPVVEQGQLTLVTPPPTETRTSDTAERRQLTVMFCDLVGSTELSGQLDAEEYREVVRAYQSTCAEVIEQFGCFVAQTLGDGLLIYSEFPVASERDAENAVRTGLGIIEAMKTLNERLEHEKGIRLAVRIGIHTGPCVIGEIRAGARQEQLALGEVPNVAARIQGLAQPAH